VEGNPISNAGKKAWRLRHRVLKGLVNLLWIPIVNQLRADLRWRTAFKKKRPVESG
jgi:hypothetical protein